MEYHDVLSALGATKWFPLDRNQAPFAVGLWAILSSGAGLTYSVQHTIDPLTREFRPVTIARAGTVATVTDVGHNLSTGDNVIVQSTESSQLNTLGADVTVTGADTYTYVVANAGPTAGGVNSRVKTFRVLEHATMTAKTTSADGNYQFPVQAIRLKVTAYTSGNVTFDAIQGSR